MANKKEMTFDEKRADALQLFKDGRVTAQGYKNLIQVIRDEQSADNLKRWRQKKSQAYPTSPNR